MQIRTRLPLRQTARAFFGAEQLVSVAHQIKRTFESMAVDHNFDSVTLQNISYGPAGQRLRGDMTDASSR